MCFNKSKGVLITGPKLKAFRNPQPSWGFSVHNKTTVAVANKNARIIWSMLRNETEYQIVGS